MKNRKIITVFISIIMLTIIGFSLTNGETKKIEPTVVYAKGQYVKITSDQAVEMMKKEKNYVIVDVRTPEEYKEGHIPNAINIPLDTIDNYISQNVENLKDKNQLMMVYCRSGRRSAEASKKLLAKGYMNVIDFGGINDWKGEIVK